MPRKVNTTKDTTKEKTKSTKNYQEEKKAESNVTNEPIVNNINGMISPELIAAITQSVVAAMMSNNTSITQSANPQVEESEIEVKEEPKKEKIVYTKSSLGKISDEEVMVKSAIRNVVFKSPRSGIEYNWLDRGDVESMPINDIIAMENKSKRFLHTPWLIIEDERVQQALGLERLYNLIRKVENVDEIVTLEKEELKKIFNELPNDYRKGFIQEIYIKVKTRELRDMRIIDNLEEILKVDLKNIK